MTEITITTSGFSESEKNLRGFAATMTDLRPFWPLVVPLFISWMREQFESEGAWGGAAWAPLSEAYAEEKTAGGFGESILIRTGDMRDAASRPQRTATPSMLVLSIVDPKIEFHQGGTQTMPARPVIPDPLPLSAERQLEAVANEYVRANLKRFGL